MADNKTNRFIDWMIVLGGAAAVGRGLYGLLTAKDASTNVGRLSPPSRPDEAPRSEIIEVHTLEDRIALISELIIAGRRDGKIWKDSRQILGRKCGEDWCVAERDYDGEVKALFYDLQGRVRYVLDPIDFDTYARTGLTLDAAGGDCDDAAITLGSYLGSVGYPVKLRVIQLVNSLQEWDHIYVLVGTPPDAPEKWVSLDLTVRSPPGWEVPQHYVQRAKDFDVEVYT